MEEEFPNQHVLQKMYEVMNCSPKGLVNGAYLTCCGRCCSREIHVISWAWTADDFEKIQLHSIEQPDCPLWQSPKS